MVFRQGRHPPVQEVAKGRCFLHGRYLWGHNLHDFPELPSMTPSAFPREAGTDFSRLKIDEKGTHADYLAASEFWFTHFPSKVCLSTSPKCRTSTMRPLLSCDRSASDHAGISFLAHTLGICYPCHYGLIPQTS